MTMLWRRLDTPGHDSCRVEHRDGEWHLEGTAVFRHGNGPARLDYRVVCDDAWCALRGSVHGWLGARAVAIDVARTAHGAWIRNGLRVPGLDACVDLDFGFTPATNFTQLQRCNLAVGAHADVPVAWTDADSQTLELLPQRYERRSATTYWYESPTTGYSALLELAANGFVRRYPSLWESVD